MFWFTSNLAEALFVRKKEIHDNVIPSSNSGMAKVLFQIGKHFEDMKYSGIAAVMLHNIEGEIQKYPSSFSNWAQLLLFFTKPYYEIAITGAHSLQLRNELAKHYLPNKIISATKSPSELPLLKGRHKDGQTLIYVCSQGACQLPVETVSEALKYLSVV
jgi:uncharacterized protein YyaL (SSP411 family)